jgi:hypothetical protein
MGPPHVTRDTLRISPVPRGLLERYVTGFRDLTAVYLKGVSHWNKR